MACIGRQFLQRKQYKTQRRYRRHFCPDGLKETKEGGNRRPLITYRRRGARATSPHPRGVNHAAVCAVLGKNGAQIHLMRAMFLGVMTARLVMMLFGVAGVAMRGMRMMRGFVMIASPMMLSRFSMMFGSVLVMFCCLEVVINCVLAHFILRGFRAAKTIPCCMALF